MLTVCQRGSLCLAQGIKIVVVDSIERHFFSNNQARLKQALKNAIRRARFHRHKYKFLAGLKYDGAPYNKTGDDTSQTMCGMHITNEHTPITQESLMLLGLINAAEDSPGAKFMCQQLDKKLRSLQLKIETAASTDQPYRLIDGTRINALEILLTMDLKAANAAWAVEDTAQSLCYTCWGV